MDTDQLYAFAMLKKEIREKAKSKLGIEKPLADWSLENIHDFQSDLEEACKSSISEKWIYTHFKNDSAKLPRIDVLNLLSKWLDYRNWDEFLQKHHTPDENKGKNILYRLMAPIAALLVIVLAIWVFLPKNGGVVMVFKDAYTQKHINPQELTLKINHQILSNTTVPIKMLGDTLLAAGPYYKEKMLLLPSHPADTFFIELMPDDYALMLNFFSRSTAADLDRRWKQLENAIHPEAKIFQSYTEYDGIELLNRDEFIERLLLPTKSLKNLEIQHILYREEKIYRLQFTQKSEENESE